MTRPSAPGYLPFKIRNCGVRCPCIERLAPRLLAEWGDDRTRYADATSVQSLAGTAPVPFQSGNYAKAYKRFACLKPLRNALHQFAWQSTLKKAGRGTMTSANGQRARPTVWRSAPWPMSGCASSIVCG